LLFDIILLLQHRPGGNLRRPRFSLAGTHAHQAGPLDG